MRGRAGWFRATLAVSAVAVIATGCTTSSPSVLDAQGTGAERVARLWWILFGFSMVAIAAVVVLLVLAIVRRGRVASTEPRWPLRLVVGGGVVFPVLALTTVWVITLVDMRALSAPASPPTLTVDVTGHRWWWEVRYPGLGVVTANEIHVPVGEPVLIRLDTSDVIHSFWVPELAGKMDMIPGRSNQMWIQAKRAGDYRGQCAEYCGSEHALMIFHVVAEPPASFQAWAARERANASPPAQALARQGMEVFLSQPCEGCHTIRGISIALGPGSGTNAEQPATAVVGPDLTHLASRGTIGAGALSNTPSHVAAWVNDAQAFKPGVFMPPVDLTSDQLEALVAFLDGLR
jgi:cytochrome c oxidase subunit II